jgi:hypothetical protein
MGGRATVRGFGGITPSRVRVAAWKWNANINSTTDKLMEDDVIKDSDMPETNPLARKRLAMNFNDGHVEKQNSDRALVPVMEAQKLLVTSINLMKERNLIYWIRLGRMLIKIN